MAKKFRECAWEQEYLLPPSLDDWLPQGHLARFVGEVCAQLDLTGIFKSYSGDGRGMAAYHPLMMVRLLLYGYATGRRSSRGIERATYEDVAFRYLSVNQHPDHDTIAAFRQRHLAALEGLFAQVLGLCGRAGLNKIGVVAIDGTKIMASANPQQTVRYNELDSAERRLARWLLEEAERIDAEEDARYGKGNHPGDLPPELATAEQRLKKLREAKAQLEQEARERAEAADKERQASGGKHKNQAAKKRYQRAHTAIDKANPQYNWTDPDSKIMRDVATGGWVQAYNAQAAVNESQVIVAAEISSAPVDRAQLVPMAHAVHQALGQMPEALLADAGYFSTEAFADPLIEQCHVLIRPDGGGPKSRRNPQPRNQAQHWIAQRLRAELQTEAGRALYGKRKILVEPVFGQIKEARSVRRFLLRGIEKVRAEWRLICLTHNLLKLFRAEPAPTAA
jgi:transposase